MPHATAPALNADDGVAAVQYTELDSVHDTPLEAAVDILLPGLGLEVGLLLVEQEGVHATVQVRILRARLAYQIIGGDGLNLPCRRKRCEKP